LAQRVLELAPELMVGEVDAIPAVAPDAESLADFVVVGWVLAESPGELVRVDGQVQWASASEQMVRVLAAEDLAVEHCLE